MEDDQEFDGMDEDDLEEDGREEDDFEDDEMEEDDLGEDEGEERVHEYVRRLEENIEARRQYSFIGELVECYDRGDDLLEKLRTKEDLDYMPLLEKEFKQLIYLIERHSSKFPSKLRSVMANLKDAIGRLEEGAVPPMIAVYQRFREIVWIFVNGEPILVDTEATNGSWHGPNVDYDTEEELELVLRLCPDIFRFAELDDLLALNERYTEHAKAVRFVPLLLDMNYYNHRNGLDLQHHAFTLLNNDNAKTPEHDDEFLRAFLLFPEKKLIDKDHDMKSLTGMFLCDTINSSTSTAFIKKRLQVITAYDPTLLEAKQHHSYLLEMFKEYNDQTLDPYKTYDEDDKVGLEFYEMFLDLGMILYPKEVLFVFYGTNFEVACDLFGEEQVKEVFNDKFANILTSSTNKNETLFGLASKAATDESIHIDGLYSVLRSDPSMLQGKDCKK